jgi:hypothetical protein
VLENSVLSRIFVPKRGKVQHCIMRISINCMLHKMLLSNQIKQDEMSRSYSMYRRDERCIQNVVQETLKERGYSDDLGIDRRTILEFILQM